MADLYVAQRTFFTYNFICQYRETAPKIDGRLGDWDETWLLPDLMCVADLESFAKVYMAWNDDGLYLALEVKRKTNYKIDPQKFSNGDCFEIFLDTRDVKDGQRANRYCYRFYFLPGGRGTDGERPIGRQTTIHNAREQAPPCPDDGIQVGLRRLKRSYQMEIHLPSNGLNGFQPREFDRMGFTYLLHDSEHGLQSWSAGRDQAVTSNPSTWGTIEFATL